MNPITSFAASIVAASLFTITLVSAEEANLIPSVPNSAPDYFCTWNVQGFVSSYANADAQADAMIEANIFGNEPHQNWAEFYPEVRADLIFLLDDAFDFPLGGGHHAPQRGSVELDAGRFPSFQGTPVQRLTQLNRDLQAKGWRSLGLWICNSRNRLPGQESVESDVYWPERLAWSQQAGVNYWKVDWGIGDRDKPLWKFKVTPNARKAAPDVWLEFNTQGDVYRTYDVGITVSIPETIRRIAAFLDKEDANDRRMINCEDEVYIGAALGCHYGIMRHPLVGNLPNGKTDGVFPAHFRDVKRRIDEVTRAVRWHRIAQPFAKGDRFTIDEAILTDFKSKPAPARIARGGMALPNVVVADGEAEPPYVLCARHPDGEIAVATIPRNFEVNGRATSRIPRAEVSLSIGDLRRPIGIFGEYASLTLMTTSKIAGQRILAQDLAGTVPVDITDKVRVGDDRLIIPGSVIHEVGLMAAKPGDISDPGLVLVVKDHTKFVAKQTMKPGSQRGPMAVPEKRPSTEISNEPEQAFTREGLVLWLTAEDAAIDQNANVVKIFDRSSLHNDAKLRPDPKNLLGNPAVVKHEQAERPVLRFNGACTGYEFKKITDARTVFYVVSKHPSAFKQFAERFVLGGKQKQDVDFHVGAHWTDTIIELGVFRHGQVWFNGFPIDPALSEFSSKLAVVSFAAGRDVVAEQLARDRDFVDRSWYGDIGEVLIYRRTLSEKERRQVEDYLLKKYAITPFKPVTVSRESVLPGHTKPPVPLPMKK